MTRASTNFGKIGEQRIITFQRTRARRGLMPAWCRGDAEICAHCKAWITPAESFRRWKVARKAWATRRKAKQLELGL